ncbi:hypothetical protein BJF93_07505 [Xaviernesmea oryzae]|uniref:Lysine transporter LysE n=1 Tax=Xaviernesmea oryzae TaxID=464029 RepID=A0A1Q9B1U8_9HYPH|nr:LysE family transporter [Xaviernesmea oryzae]OLP61962.1 hypothetical protein BJF93_07505 [Xaviernesmea oryzae]SEK99368.1 LysE type translocator [Xaviernesmea oryzae]
MDSFLSSWFFGLSIAMPFGPVSMMCVEQSLARGVGHGMASGAGAATTHGVYATIALLGAQALAAPLAALQTEAHLLSGLVFSFLGIWTMLRLPAQRRSQTSAIGGFAPYLTGVALALANPMTLLPYIAFSSSLALINPAKGIVQLLVIAGVGLGTLSWYWTMSGSAWLLRQRLPRTLLAYLHLIAGPTLIGIGIMTVLR